MSIANITMTCIFFFSFDFKILASMDFQKKLQLFIYSIHDRVLPNRDGQKHGESSTISILFRQDASLLTEAQKQKQNV